MAGVIAPHVSRTAAKARDALRQISVKVADRMRTKWTQAGLGKAANSDVSVLVDRLLSEAAPDDDFMAVPAFMHAEMTAIFKEAGYEMLTQLGLGDDAVSTQHVDKRAVQYAQSRGAELVGMKVTPNGTLVENPDATWSISESTRDMLRGLVTEGVEEGWSADKLATAIQEDDAFGDARAETIARTELAFAATDSHRTVAQDTGAVAKVNLLGSEHDDDVPDGDECNEATDRGVIGVDEEFVPGYQNAPFHPRCVCDTEYIYDDDPRAADFIE